MDQQAEKTTRPGPEKLQSPYPGLQTLLIQLAELNPARKSLPVFRNREEAEFYMTKFDGHCFTVVVPVWKIDHVDLRRSKIIHWSLAPYFY